MILKSPIKIILALLIALFCSKSYAQLSSIEANYSNTTQQGDLYFIFCANKNSSVGSLTATSPYSSKSSFLWEKYDTLSNMFSQFGVINPNDSINSSKYGLSDGCYKVTISTETESTSYKAWVLNNWIEVIYTEIPDSTSNCEEFKIEADFDYAPLRIFNTETHTPYSVRNKFNDFEFKWTLNGDLVRSSLNPYIYPPIASNSPLKYELTINDEFNCSAKGSVDYNSKVTKAEFTITPMEGEAVLPIEVTNSSINYDSIIWFFYKDSDRISKEIEAANGGVIDSVDFKLFTESPKHEYERSGQYQIKLVTIKINETGNCYDTLFMQPGTFIKVDTSYINVPNVFTPNGDGQNDVLMVQTHSLKSMTFKIYNRWGGLVHSWKYSNIRSSDYTYEHAVWDGRIGNKMATPGVYFWVIRAVGRDLDKTGKEKQINEEGFFHLFREKQ